MTVYTTGTNFPRREPGSECIRLCGPCSLYCCHSAICSSWCPGGPGCHAHQRVCLRAHRAGSLVALTPDAGEPMAPGSAMPGCPSAPGIRHSAVAPKSVREGPHTRAGGQEHSEMSLSLI